LHLLEQRDLSNGCGRDAFILGFQANLLERDDALIGCGEIKGFVDDSVCAYRDVLDML